jgi:hypothetical protein
MQVVIRCQIREMQSRNDMHVGRGRTDHFGPAGSARCRATNLLILTLHVSILPGITGLESILHVAHALLLAKDLEN